MRQLHKGNNITLTYRYFPSVSIPEEKEFTTFVDRKAKSWRDNYKTGSIKKEEPLTEYGTNYKSS